MLRQFLATLEGFSDDHVLLNVLPENRRVRMRVSASFEALLRPCLEGPLEQVYAVTAHGDEIVNVVPYLADERTRQAKPASSPRHRKEATLLRRRRT